MVKLYDRHSVMTRYLRSRGWRNGWAGDDWVAPGVNADWGSTDIETAFKQVFKSDRAIDA